MDRSHHHFQEALEHKYLTKDISTFEHIAKRYCTFDFFLLPFELFLPFGDVNIFPKFFSLSRNAL